MLLLVATKTLGSRLSLLRLLPLCRTIHRTSPRYTTTTTMSATQLSLVEGAKKAAAERAVADHLDPSYRYIGIGSGSTVVYVVAAIAARGPAFHRNMVFFPTGSQSRALIRTAGFALCNIEDRAPAAPPLDVTFDGADEVDAELNCIKGGGACLFREKIVAAAARKFVVVADYRKMSPRLCTQWKTIPIEVVPVAADAVLLELRALGSEMPLVRSGLPSKAGECVTDNGMWIIDAPFAPLLLPSDVETSGGGGGGKSWEIGNLAQRLINIVGVLEIGLFHGRTGPQAEALGQIGSAQKPVAAYFGMQDGEVRVVNSQDVV